MGRLLLIPSSRKFPMLVANFTLCTTCKNNRGARRWAGARTPIWSPPAAGRGARILTILYNSLQLCTGETWSSPGTSSTLIYTYTQQELFYSIIASVCFCFSPHYYFFMAVERNHSEEREGSLLSRQHFQCSLPSPQIELQLYMAQMCRFERVEFVSDQR